MVRDQEKLIAACQRLGLRIPAEVNLSTGEIIYPDADWLEWMISELPVFVQRLIAYIIDLLDVSIDAITEALTEAIAEISEEDDDTGGCSARPLGGICNQVSPRLDIVPWYTSGFI